MFDSLIFELIIVTKYTKYWSVIDSLNEGVIFRIFIVWTGITAKDYDK